MSEHEREQCGSVYRNAEGSEIVCGLTRGEHRRMPEGMHPFALAVSSEAVLDQMRAIKAMLPAYRDGYHDRQWMDNVQEFLACSLVLAERRYK